MKILSKDDRVIGWWPGRVKGSGVVVGHGKVRHLLPMKWAIFKRQGKFHVEPVLVALTKAALRALGLSAMKKPEHRNPDQVRA